MEFKLVESLQYGVDNGSIGNEDTDSANRPCTSTPHPTRRPLQQLNVPTSASPRTQSSVTPYRYHKCQVIPEEVEDQENVDPKIKKDVNKASNQSIKSRGLSSDETSNDESSPFAYPLIWESHHIASSSSSSTHSPSCHVKLSPVGDGSCYESPKSHVNDIGRTYIGGSGSHEWKVGKRLHSTRDSSHEDHGLERNLDKETTTEKNRNKCGSSHGESSCSKSHSHRGPAVTPSKSTLTPSPSDEPVFRTPSERFSSKCGDNRAQTPQHRRVNHHHNINPFEVGAECLQLPAVSPSLFRQVVSPSQKVDSKFRWSIDQLAVLNPANIETSPFNQGDVLTDPDYERQAQDAIDKFFTHQSVVPSPWTGSNKAVNLLQTACTPIQPTPSHPTPHTNTVWCQTELTLPPNLSEAVEEVLKPFCTFTQDQWWQGGNEGDEGTNINNTTLRRKLLFSHEELLNATPMCSPRGADNSGVGSPSSSPVAPLPLHEDDENPKGVEEEEEEGLVWCTAVVGPGSTNKSKEDPQLAWNLQPTPPSPSMCLSPPTVMQQSGLSYIVGMSPLPQINSSLPFLSPNMSPINDQINSQVTAQPRLLSSPDVSPIQQCSTDLDYENLCSSASSLINQILHSHSQSANQVSPRVSPVHISIESQYSVTQGRNFSSYSASSIDKVFQSGSSLNLFPPEKDPKQEETGVCPNTGHQSSLEHSCNQKLCSPTRQQTQSMIISNCLATAKNTSTLTVQKTECINESQLIPCSSSDASVEIVTTVESNISPLNQESILETCDQSFEILEKQTDKRHKQMDKALDMTQGFTISEYDNTEHQETPAKSSPLRENKTSSNSGHFSSSPIRDICRSPLEMDTPNRRFSASPPLSPILCRSLMFQSQHNHHKFQSNNQQDNSVKANLFSLSQATHMNYETEGRSYDDEIMMEDSHNDAASDARYISPIIVSSLPTTVTLHQSSSICDMETDSHPSLEINVNDEGPLQDTGYQTGSLHATNFSVTASSQENNFTNSVVPPQLKEQHSIVGSVSCTQSNNSIIKVIRSDFAVSCEKEFSN
ncbi:uncharacterized protein bora isoform X2 [Panulirus ornatus]|uniref:uncharacterized protein bora isoform X2 n=1 Tax=Panulirus ornatus TaxID=150431 RepID=UPI003A8C5CDA